MYDWLQKLRLLIVCRLASVIEIKPFLQRDSNEYCPCCGDLQPKKMQSAVLKAPDEGGSNIAVHYTCGRCKFEFLQPSVSVIDENHIMPAPLEEEDKEQRAIDLMAADKRTKYIRSEKKVNGQLVS